jgi:hypothetical protein
MEVLHINGKPVKHKRNCPVVEDLIAKFFPEGITNSQASLFRTKFHNDETCELNWFVKKAAGVMGVRPKSLWEMVSFKPLNEPVGVRFNLRPEVVVISEEEDFIIEDDEEEEVVTPRPKRLLERDDYEERPERNVPQARVERNFLIDVPFPTSLPPVPPEPAVPTADLYLRIIDMINATIKRIDKTVDETHFKLLLSMQLKYIRALDECVTPGSNLPSYSVSQRANMLGVQLEEGALSRVGKRARQLYLKKYNGKEPTQRVIDVGVKRVPINVYNADEAKYSLDIAIREEIN